jgi:subtilase family serine protease
MRRDAHAERTTLVRTMPGRGLPGHNLPGHNLPGRCMPTVLVACGGWLLAVLALASVALARPERPVCPGPAAEGSARCHAHVVVDSHGSPATSSLPAGYGPVQFHGAYSLPSSSPVPQTIAIVDAYDDPSARSDLSAYDKTYGIPDLPTCPSTSTSTTSCFLKVNQSGSTSPLPSKNAGWALEIALDVETAHEICQNCKLVLVEASSSSATNLDAAEATAVRLGATEISNSWGTNGEYFGELSENSSFNHPGIAITVASGDNGYERFGFPAASPDVIDAGGTTLTLGAGNTYGGEKTWSGSGSGCSLYFSAQSWQGEAAGWSATGCGTFRGVADLAADANPNTGASVYDTTRYSGRSGWFQVGGTSLASPLIAGVYALAGNVRNAELDPSGYPASIAYSHSSALHDVVEGPSTGSCSTTACKAASGYDGPTGLGTPNGLGGF